MKMSNKNLIKDSEHLGPEYAHNGHIVAYLDSEGVPTIGWGHTKGVLHTDVGVRSISMEQAEAFLESDVADSEAYVNKLNLKLTQNQFDALTDLAFNVGSFGWTLTSQLQAGKFAAVPATIKRYIHTNRGPACAGRCGNKTCKLRTEPGLITRRAAEAALFTKKGA